MKLYLFLIFSIFFFTANANVYYVATNGNDVNSGSISSPFATLIKFNTVSVAGDTCYVRGGLYTPTDQVVLNKAGTSSAWIRILNYPNESPVFDGANTNNASFTHGIIKMIFASYTHVKGLEFKNTVKEEISGLIVMSCNNILIERCIAHHIRAVGFVGYASTVNAGSNLTFLNCDSYENDDWGGLTPHEDADGFQMTGPNFANVKYIGCRAWNNADDGWDFYFSSANTITLENCWAFKNGVDVNGVTLGNGNAYKMGGNSSTTGGVTLKQCLAWKNIIGFTWNGGAGGPFTLHNCTGWSNTAANYDFGGTAANVLKNNISFAGPNYTNSQANTTFNSWTLPVTLTSADFASLDDASATSARQVSGDLPVIQFLHLVSGSDLIDKGTNVGLPFTGSAPDLGAFEYTGSSTPDTIAPTQPVITGASNITSTSFSLNWNASTDNVGVTGYDVYKNGVLFGSTSGTSLLITGLTANTQYQMTVKAKDAAGNISTASSALAVTTTNTPPASSNIALNKPVLASSTQGGGSYSPAYTVDNNTLTSWKSNGTGTQWLYVDLGTVSSITSIVTKWGTPYGKTYSIQISNDATAWTTIFSTTTGSGGNSALNTTQSCRYVRILITFGSHNKGGYNINEFEVYGTAGLASSRMAPTANVAETTLGKFAAFPNPVNDVLTITLDQKVDQTRVSLFNLTGHLLLRKTINSQTTSIDFSNFKSGSYILKIEQNGKSFIQKIIK